jgi:uncharacterized LabA/DUF88 family protein
MHKPSSPPDRLKELIELFDGDTHVYIDYANVRKLCSGRGWNVDLKKLRGLLQATGKVKSARFYFGTILGDKGSEGFISRVRKEGFEVVTKPVKHITASIDASSVVADSPDILRGLINEALIRELGPDAIKYLNARLIELNKAGKRQLRIMKCNFDVEIATDLRLDHALGKAQTYCLWSGDSDFAHPLLCLLNAKRKVVVVSSRMATELSDLRGDGLIFYDMRKLRELIQQTK